MEIKEGKIIKVITKKKSEYRGIVDGVSNSRDGEFIAFHLITEGGKSIKFRSDEIEKVSSTKMDSELRKKLQEAYRISAQMNDLLQKKRELERKHWELITSLENKKKEIATQSDIFEISALRDIVYHSYSENTISFSRTLFEQKYARVHDFDSLYLEYDTTLSWSSHKELVDELKRIVGNRVSAISFPKFKNLKLKETFFDAGIGDKNTIYLEEVFTFEIPKKPSLKAVTQEIKEIEKILKHRPLNYY